MLLPLVLGRQGMQLRVPLWLAGKLGVRGLVNAVAPGQLIYVNDQLSNRRFLVDTGAAYSILPHHSSSQPTGPPLAGPDGHPLACWGDKPVHLVESGLSSLLPCSVQSSALIFFELIISRWTLSTTGC